MQLTKEQQKGLDKAVDWFYNSAKQIFCLQGYAGTGKSTLLKFILTELGLELKDYMLLAPTGKAARVITEKTKIPALTIHKFIYQPKADRIVFLQQQLAMAYDINDVELIDSITDEIELLQKNKKSPKFDLTMDENTSEIFKLIVIDEASMMSEKVWKDIQQLNFNKILLIGDPFQLPPIKAKPAWSNIKPDVVLTKIMRQTGDGSGITLCAEQIRKGNAPIEGQGMQIVNGRQSMEFYNDSDIVICGTNATRRILNKHIRKLRGFTSINPQNGDKIICRQNNKHFRIVNGEQFTIKRITDLVGNFIYFDLVNEFGENYPNMKAWLPFFQDDSTSVVPYGCPTFSFSYAITCHSSQGSGWKNVIVVDEWKGAFYEQWLYTAITRAIDSCKLVRNPYG